MLLMKHFLIDPWDDLFMITGFFLHTNGDPTYYDGREHANKKNITQKEL